MNAEKKVGLFFVVGLVILLILTMTVEDLSLPFLRDEYQLVGYFQAVGELRVGNTVTIAGMPVGRIKDFHLKDKEIRVRFSVEEQYRIPVDSTAEIVMSSLLGGNQLNITLGDSRDYLRDQQEITTLEMISMKDVVNSVTDVSHSIQTLASNFDENQQEFFERVRYFLDDSEGKIHNIIANFEDASENMNIAFARVEGTMDNVDAISDNFLLVSDNLAQGRGTIGRLLHDEELYENINMVSDDIKNMLATLQNQESLLGKLMYSEEIGDDFEVSMANVREVSAELQAIISNRGEEFEDIITNLHGSSQSLNTMTQTLVVLSEQIEMGEGTLGKLIGDDELYREIQALIRDLHQAVRNVEETVINNSVFSVFLSGVR